MQEKNIKKIHEAIEGIIDDEIGGIVAQWKELLKENETLKKEISLKNKEIEKINKENKRILNDNTELRKSIDILVKDGIIENKFEEYYDCNEYGYCGGFQSNKFIYKGEIIFEDYVNI